MLAVWEPRLSSCMSCPADVSKILMRVPCANTEILIWRKHWKCISTCKIFLLRITHFFWRCSYPCALQVESDAAQCPLMGWYVHWRLLCVGQVHDLHVAWMSPRKCQQRVVTVRTQHTQTWGGRGRRLVYTHISNLSFKCRHLCDSRQSQQSTLTFGVVAGLKHMQLMGVVGKGEYFDHWVQNHHNPENKGEAALLIWQL